MNINIKSGSDCKMLLDRIERTLTATSFNISRLRRQPGPFCKDDTCIFKGLSEAILSNRAVWSSVQLHLNTIGQVLYAYNINKVASLSNGDLDKLYTSRLKPLKIRSQRLRKRLEEIRDNASAFQDFTQKYGSVCNFISSYLNGGRIEHLRSQFIGKCAGFKLHGVGMAICSEFFNNIGIDEFKADSNTTRFFKRTGMAAENASPDDIRAIGITIAENSGKPRVYVDSLIWHFCAEDEGQICTKNNPRCYLCKLKSRFCEGISNNSALQSIITVKQNRKGGIMDQDKLMPVTSNDKYVLQGTVYYTEGRWEIGWFKKDEIGRLPYNKYPFVPQTGIAVTLVIGRAQYKYGASFHHYPPKKYGQSYIGSATLRTGNISPLGKILHTYGLDNDKQPVRLEFDEYNVSIFRRRKMMLSTQ